MAKALARLALIAALAVIPGIASADDAANAALTRQFYGAFNDRDFDAFEEVMATDFVDRSAGPTIATGVGIVRARMEDLAAEIPDIRMTITLLLVSGDYVTVVTNARGVMGGAMPADQRLVSFQAIDIWLIRDGVLAELWHSEQPF